jgi:hypothetical protein
MKRVNRSSSLPIMIYKPIYFPRSLDLTSSDFFLGFSFVYTYSNRSPAWTLRALHTGSEESQYLGGEDGFSVNGSLAGLLSPGLTDSVYCVVGLRDWGGLPTI